jgi:hypothetical protein
LNRAIKAFLLAVLTAAVVGTVDALAFGLVHIWANGGSRLTFTASDFSIWAQLFVYLAVFATFSMVFLVVPLTAVLSRFRIERAWTYPFLGLAVGLAVAHVFGTPTGESYSYEILLFLLVIGALPGCMAGAVWWKLFRRSKASSIDQRA